MILQRLFPVVFLKRKIDQRVKGLIIAVPELENQEGFVMHVEGFLIDVSFDDAMQNGYNSDYRKHMIDLFNKGVDTTVSGKLKVDTHGNFYLEGGSFGFPSM